MIDNTIRASIPVTVLAFLDEHKIEVHSDGKGHPYLHYECHNWLALEALTAGGIAAALEDSGRAFLEYSKHLRMLKA